MEEEIVRFFEEDPEEYKILTIEDIKNNLDNLEIEGIRINDRMTIFGVVFLHNDKNHPIALEKSSNTIEINPEWYLENPKLVDELVSYICQNTKEENFTIGNKELINDKLIDVICQNTNFREISLAPFEENGYKLTSEHYLKFKKSNIEAVETNGVSKELEDNFDALIEFNWNRTLISNYNYRNLSTQTRLYINKMMTEEEIHNLKHVNPNATLEFWNESWINIDKINEELEKIEKPIKLVIEVKNKEKFNHSISTYNNITNNNVYIKIDGMEIPIKDYLKFERQLYEILEGTKDLSPFEKYIYIYNKTKTFKKYQENEEDVMSSRKLYYILENQFMVCVGFSKLFGDLLDKQGIKNQDVSVMVDVSYDEAFRGKENVEGIERAVEKEGHARRYVHIVDEKYGIDGFYIADPTWDNDLEKDYYNHLAMTNKEIVTAKRYLWINKCDSSELLNIESIEEFYQKINFILDRDRKFLLDKSQSDLSQKLNDLIKDLINKQLAPLDYDNMEQLKNKYPFITKNDWPEDITDLIYDLGIYILNYVNKEIKGETIIEAVGNVYKKAYGYTEEEWQIKREEIVEQNRKRQEKQFPKRYKTNPDGSEEILMNETNKFDIELETKTK